MAKNGKEIQRRLRSRQFLYLCVALGLSIASGCNYTHPSELAKNKFRDVIGFYPPPETINLSVVSGLNGEHEYYNLSFSTNKETVDRILGKCFYEVSKNEISSNLNDSNRHELEEFFQKEAARFYERPDREVEKTGCMGDMHYSYFAYDEESGKAFFQWNKIHF